MERPSVTTMPSLSDYPTIADAIRAKLEEAFEPSHLEVTDQSHLHAGHAGAAEHPGGESHFHVSIVSDRFREIPRVARHQAIYEVLSEVIPHIHALSINAREGDGPPDTLAGAATGGGTVQGHHPENTDPETGKSKAWATKDTTKSTGLSG